MVPRVSCGCWCAWASEPVSGRRIRGEALAFWQSSCPVWRPSVGIWLESVLVWEAPFGQTRPWHRVSAAVCAAAWVWFPDRLVAPEAWGSARHHRDDSGLHGSIDDRQCILEFLPGRQDVEQTQYQQHGCRDEHDEYGERRRGADHGEVAANA